MGAAIGVVLTSFTALPQTAFAAQGPNPYSQAVIELDYDGTGHGTPAQTFITTANGYSPADDTDNDRVVASSDVAGYKIRVNIEAGPARTINVGVLLPDALIFEPALNAQLCLSNQFVTGVLTGTDTAPVCQYTVRRGVPVTLETNLRLRGADTAGAAIADQVVQVTTSLPGQAVHATDSARSVTVISAPMADLTVRPSECPLDNVCSGISLAPGTTSGSFEIETWALRKSGLANDKGSSKGSPWTAGLDVTGFPAGTTWNVGGSSVTPVDGVLPLQGTGNVRVSYSVPANWGGAEFVDGEVRDFPVSLVVPDTAFSTADFLNNGDGWQPGTGASREESTANVRETGAKRGWRYANNDHTFVRVLKPVPETPTPGINFNKSLQRPWNSAQTLFEIGNIRFSNGDPTQVHHTGYVDRVAEGTQILTHLTVYSNEIESETPLRVSVADQWDPTQLTATGPVTVTNPAGQVMTTGFTVYWSRTATGATVPDATVAAGWTASNEPLSGSRAVRVVFDELPVGALPNAGTYTVQIPHQVSESLPRPLPTRLTDTGGIQIGDTLGRTVTEYVVPVSADTWLPTVGMTAKSNPEVDLDRTNSAVTYTFTPKVEALASSTAPITGTVTVTLDPCITAAELKSAGWEVVSVDLGTGCGTNNPVAGTIVLRPAGGSFDPTGKVNARAVTLPPIVIDTHVSQLAEPAVTTSASWQMTSQGNTNYTADSVPPAGAYRTIGAERVITVTAELATTTPRQEVGDPLRFDAVVYGRGDDTTAAGTETVIVLPGKGNDASFLNELESASGNTSYRDDPENPLASDFQGTYTLTSATIRSADSVEGTQLLCTTKNNPNFDPAQAGANWSETCGPNTTAVKIVQPGGDNQGISVIDIELLPVGDRFDDVFLAWIGPIHLSGAPAAMAWPASDVIIASTVSGIVYWDESGAGSNWRDPWAGIPDATLELLDSDGNVLETTTSGSDGRYEFTNLHSRTGAQVRVSDTPVSVPSVAIPGSTDRTVAQTFSYNGKRLGNASATSTAFTIPVSSTVTNVNFGFFAADPYTDVKKDVAQVQCGSTGNTCDVEWDVTIRNGGNTTLTEGMFTDVTSSRVYDVQVAGVSQAPKFTEPALTAGEEHSLALTEAGEVYSFGRGSSGQLGHDNVLNQETPVKIAGFGTGPNETPITSIVAGGYFSLMLSEAGELYSFGYGYSGALGHGNEDNLLVPTKIQFFEDQNISVTAIAAGEYHTLVLAEDGNVYSFGNNINSQLGHGDTANRDVPTKIQFFEDQNISVTAIAAGAYSSFVLTDTGDVYSFGQNLQGSLGHGDTTLRALPTKIQFFDNQNIVASQIEARGFNTFVISNDGVLYAFGAGSTGQLGITPAGNKSSPTKVTFFENENLTVSKVKTGFQHTIVMTDDGAAYSFGNGGQGRLGNGGTTQQNLPARIAGFGSAPNETRVASVSTGGAHSFILAETGDVYSFGDGKYGVLGHGDTNNRLTPTKIAGFSTNMPRIYGGVSPVTVTPRGEFTERVFKTPTLQPGEDITYSVRGKVNRPAPDTGIVIGNQAWFTAAETPRLTPTITPPLPAWDPANPSAAGKWVGNTTCTATPDWVTPENGAGGDACDQVYASVAPSEVPLGSLEGIVWEDTDKDGTMGDPAVEQRLENTPVKLWRTGMDTDTLVGETFTNANGEYLFTDLEPDTNYFVTFHPGSHPTPGKSWGYTTQTVTCPTVDESCANMSGITENLTVIADQRTTPVNAGLVAYAADIAVTKGHIDTNQVLQQDFDAEYETPVPVTVTVQNTGEEPLNMLEFTDTTLTGDPVVWAECVLGTETFTFPSPAVFPTLLPETWSLGVNESFTCAGTLPGMTGTQLTHTDQVTVNGVGTITGTPVTDDSEFTARTSVPPVVRDLVPAITLEKGVIDGDDFLKQMALTSTQTPTITFQVRNTGEEDLYDLRLEDSTITGSASVTNITCAWPTTVVGGVTRTVLFIDPADGPTGVDCTGTLSALGVSASHKNLAEVFAIGASTNKLVSDYSEFEATSEGPNPGITLVKSNDRVGEDLVVGDVVTYSFVVTNTGNVPLKNVTVTEIEFTGHGTVPVPVCPATQAALLAPGAQMICQAVYTMTQADVDQREVFNSAVARGIPEYPDNPTPEDPIETPPSNTVVGSTPDPSIALVKTADRERYATVGEVVTYTFRVTNTGNVSLTDPTVIETEFNGVSEFLTDPVCPATPNPLLPGQSIDCTATYTIQAADLQRESLVNIAIAEGTPPGPDPDVPEPPVQSPPDTVTVIPVLPIDPRMPEDPGTPGGSTPPGPSTTKPLARTGGWSDIATISIGGVFLAAGVALLAARRKKYANE